MHSFYNRQICPLKGFIVSAHILSCPAENKILPEVRNTSRQLTSPHDLSSHPCRSSNSFPSPPYFYLFFPPLPIVQTPHLISKYTRVINITRQLISPHYMSSHPCRNSNSSPPKRPLLRHHLNHRLDLATHVWQVPISMRPKAVRNPLSPQPPPHSFEHSALSSLVVRLTVYT